MYVPRHFAETDPGVLLAEMRAQGAATLVSHGEEGMIASHVPVEIVETPEPYGRLRCHLARANPHARLLAEGGEVLAIFQGVEGYISPSYYPSKQTNEGKVVPTWNFIAVHAYGVASVVEGEAALREHLAAISDANEQGRAEPWGLSDAPDNFITMMTKAIVGFDITLSRIEGKWKLGQNRPEPDRQGTLAGLRADGKTELAEVTQLAEAKRAKAKGA